jgi:hypothetical protein
MKFILDGKAATAALLKLQRIAGRDIDNLTLHATEAQQTLEIHAHSLQRRSLIRVPAQITQPGKITIERERFVGICKGRGKLEFIIDKHGLAFNQPGGRYAGSRIAIIPFKDAELLRLSDQPAIPEHIQAKLLPAIRACTISSVFGGQQLGLILLLHEFNFMVVTTDSYHSAIARFTISRRERRKLRRAGLRQPIILPMDYAEILARQFTGSGLTITVNNKRIIFANQEMKVELPALQSNSAMLHHALQLDRQFDSQEFILQEANTLHAIMNNIKVIGKSEHPLIMATRKGEKSVDIRFSAPTGRITDQMVLERAARQDKKLRLEPNNLYDIAGKLAKGPAVVAYNSRSVRLTCQLNNELVVNYYSSQLQQ